jgi:hypothetical protein
LQPAGFYTLWSAAGRSDYVVSGPHDGLALSASFDAGEHVHVLEAPNELSLMPGEFAVVVFFTYSQYRIHGRR